MVGQACTDPGGWKALTAATDPVTQRAILVERLIKRMADPDGLDRDALNRAWDDSEDDS